MLYAAGYGRARSSSLPDQLVTARDLTIPWVCVGATATVPSRTASHSARHKPSFLAVDLQIM